MKARDTSEIILIRSFPLYFCTWILEFHILVSAFNALKISLDDIQSVVHIQFATANTSLKIIWTTRHAPIKKALEKNSHDVIAQIISSRYVCAVLGQCTGAQQKNLYFIFFYIPVFFSP